MLLVTKSADVVDDIRILGGKIEPCHIHAAQAVLGLDEHRAWSSGCECAFADSFATVDHQPWRQVLPAFLDS